MALASMVFPQPGGPCKSTPLGGWTPVCRYISGCDNGIATNSSIFSTHASAPPKSDRRTVGGVYSFAIPLEEPEIRVLLILSSPRDERTFRFPFDAGGRDSEDS